MSWLDRFTRPARTAIGERPRLSLPEMPAALYAIGDIHGCYSQFRLLQQKIVDDSRTIAGPKCLVMLGDYVDRGPKSASVIDDLMKPPADGFTKICLAGNHEVMMIAHFDNPGRDNGWLELGGLATLASYGIDQTSYADAGRRERLSLLHSYIPQDHIEFLKTLPVLAQVGPILFVHAAAQPGRTLAEQDEDFLIWSRETPAPLPDDSWNMVVHGHTPSPQPLIEAGNINIDTGCFATGILTALRLDRTQEPNFISVDSNKPS
jgi:serine/threonine protein phosphatase 1